MSLRQVARDGAEVDALLTDRYLDSLLAAHATGGDLAPASADLDPRVRDVADRLARALPRSHPSFRFEEALAGRLAAAALARRVPLAAGGEGSLVSFESADPDLDAASSDDLGRRLFDDATDPMRPLLIRGALTSAALSLAGAAFVAWRLRRPPTPMARAVRAVARGRPA